MPLEHDSVIITAKAVDLIKENAEAIGLANVYYGDEPLMPEFPSATVEFGDMAREVTHTHKFTLLLDIFITIYHGKMQEPEINTRQSQELAEAVEAALATDRKLGGSVIFSYVSRMSPGFVSRQREMIRSHRLTLRVHTQETF